MKFKDKIKELRQEKDLSQKKLADELSLSQSCITKLESGDREPTGSTLVAYANYFNVTIDYLIGNDEVITRDNSFREKQNLSQEEKDLIKYYRAIEKPAKLAIFNTAKSFYNQAQIDKKTSYNA